MNPHTCYDHQPAVLGAEPVGPLMLEPVLHLLNLLPVQRQKKLIQRPRGMPLRP